jgi:hypothetical protein
VILIERILCSVMDVAGIGFKKMSNFKGNHFLNFHFVFHTASVVAAFNTVRACLKSSVGSDIDKIVAQ